MMIEALNKKAYNADAISFPSPEEFLTVLGLAAPVFVTMIYKIQTEYIKAKWLSPHTISAVEIELDESVLELSESLGEEEKTTVVKEWKPPELKPKRSQTGVKMVTGLASVMENEP
ncbi:hypothetical protein CerSpe_027160 [Prunus speciosa]